MSEPVPQGANNTNNHNSNAYPGGQTPPGPEVPPVPQAGAPYGQAAAPYAQATPPYAQAGAPYAQAGAPYAKAGAPAGPLVPPQRPKQVDSAFTLLMVILGLTVLSVPAGILLANAAGPDVPMAGVMILVVLGMICLAITLVAAIFIRKGHNWARILLAVYTGISVLTLVANVGLLGWWAVLALVIATVMLFRKPSPQYFQAMSQYRQHKLLSQVQ